MFIENQGYCEEVLPDLQVAPIITVIASVASGAVTGIATFAVTSCSGESE